MNAYFTHLIASLKVAVASYLDRGLEGIIGQLVALDDKLDAYASKQAAKVEASQAAADASYQRQNAVIQAVLGREIDFRETVRARAADAQAAQERAARIRERIAALLD